MIDQETFGRALAVIADRMGRPLHQATVRAYYAALSPEMTTEQFQAAARVVFRDAKFWPEPKAFLDAAGIALAPAAAPVTGQLAAGLAFNALSRYYRHHPTAGGSYDVDAIGRELGPVARAAFHAMGGAPRLRGADEERLDFARRDFVAAYDDAARLNERDPDALVAMLPTPKDSPFGRLIADVAAAMPAVGSQRGPRVIPAATGGDD